MRDRDSGAVARGLYFSGGKRQGKRAGSSAAVRGKERGVAPAPWLGEEGALRQDLVAGLERFGQGFSAMLDFLGSCKFSRLLSEEESAAWTALVRDMAQTAHASSVLVDQARDMDEAQFLSATPVEGRYVQ